MANIKVTYFDINGGRAEPIRLALHCLGQDFEDHRFQFSEFAEIRKGTPFGQVPVVELDGEQITQSNALCRYFGKQAGLYPEDDYQALLCDEVMDVVEDISHKLSATMTMTGEALKSAREQLVAPLTTYLKWLAARLTKQGGEYFADNRLTIADLKVFVMVQWLGSGMLDHIPTTLVQDTAPELLAHLNRVTSNSKIKSYYG
ncbi:glutathione S-transferase family protein [Amphritea pacifica]|uniref:Glutathione S-transferase family protein n=1 Tax=Amphritea pacifica TaxID=2811233 RepID=A0ABS2WCF5_9GAMM|nr:glutathione S-transferase family protein [Amphritea pacifica]MBN0989399.1 glutathione S-transferase family protein [Amphritea pacifica]MBN1008497.1 glutathione S-transferase family protein [Amphritea pacifica]